MPSAIFSTSFARSALIDIDERPEGSIFENSE